MVASIAQRVLSSILGKYIEGLGGENMKVGIWSGAFKLENVALKKEVADMFELPFNFKFNHIGKINAKIPWKSLGSSPVEVELEDLMIIAEPKSKEDLQQIAVNIFKERQAMLETFAGIIEEKLKKGNKEEGPGYFSGLITKVIDNVQVSIKNVHVRLECSFSQTQNFNFGITLESLSLYTVDESGNSIYLDRSKAENKDKPVNKKLMLNDLSVYWNDKGMNPFYEAKFQKLPNGVMQAIPPSDDVKTRVVEELKKTIHSGMGPTKAARQNDFQYLLNLSISARMVQYTKSQELINKGIPEISLEFELDKVSSLLSKGQFAQIMGLLDYFSDYMAMAKKEQEKLRFKYLRPLKTIHRSAKDSVETKKKTVQDWWKFAATAIKKEMTERKGFFTVLQMGKDQQQRYGEMFKSMFSKIDFANGKTAEECLTEDEYEVYQVLVLSLREPILKKQIEELLKEKTRLAKKESKKGWFGGWGKKTIELTAEEEKEIDDLLKEVVYQEEHKFQVPENFKWLAVKFAQREATIGLQRINPQKHAETVQMLFSNFEVEFFMRKSGMDVDLSLQNFEIQKKTELSKGNVITQNILQPLIKTHKENRLVSLQFSTAPPDYTKQVDGKEVQLDMLLMLGIKSSEIVYDAKMISALADVFDTSSQADALKKAAAEQAELLNKQGQQKLNDILKTQKSVIVDISIAAPLIVLPYRQDEMFTSECWILSPGILEISGDNFTKMDSVNKDEMEHYDTFKIALDKIKIEYQPSMIDYMQKYTAERLRNTTNSMLKTLNENKQQHVNTGKIASCLAFDLLKDFSIIIDLSMLKPAFVQLNFDEPKFKVGAKVTKLQVDLNQKIYADLLNFGDIFKEDWSGGSQLQTDKKGLLSYNSKYGVVIRGSSLTGFAKTKEYAILSDARLYFFKDWKAQAAYDYFTMKNAKIKSMTPEESGHPFGLKIINDNGSNILLAFEDDAQRTSWIVALENENRKLRVKATSAAENTGATAEGSSVAALDEDKKVEKPQAGPLDKHNFLAKVNFQMEALGLRVFDNDKQIFDFSILALGLGVELRETHTAVKVSLKMINIIDTVEQDLKLKTLISSEIGKSIATEVDGLGINKDHTSETLMSIDVELLEATHPKYNNVDMDIGIKFGSLFLNLRPNQINKLMKFFIPPSSPKAQVQEAPTSKPTSAADASVGKSTEAAVVQRNSKTLLSREDDKVIQMRVKFSLEKISLIMINEIKNIYIAHTSISNIDIEFISKATGMTLDGTLSNLQLHDLTNYPVTLSVSDFEKIKPNELFGIASTEGEGSLIKLHFEMINAAVTKLPEENISGYLEVSVSQIKVNFYMQVVMRILDFVTGHVLPALNVDDAPTEAQKAVQKKEELPGHDQLHQKDDVLVHNLQNPFWMKMKVDITKPIVILKCAPHFKEYLQVELGNIKIRNQRVQNSSRLIVNHADARSKELGLGDKFLGIWTETFFISMEDINIKKVVEKDSGNYFQYFMHPFNFNLSVEMCQFPDEYLGLFKAKSDPLEAYTEYNLSEKTPNYVSEDSPHLIFYDGGMGVKARISPMIMVFGNAEFNFLMKTLFHNITYNDFQDENFVKDFVEKKKQEELQQQTEEASGSSMSICIDIDYISLVAMESEESSSEGVNDNQIAETRKVFGKLFIKELRVEVLMVSSGEMHIGAYIRNLVGSYLQAKQKNSFDFIEKGFIGKMSVCNEFSAKDADDLRKQVVSNLHDSISEKGDSGSYGLTHYDKQKLMLNVGLVMFPDGTQNIKVELTQMRILAQTDVLLRLSGLAQMSPDCQPPAPQVDPEVKRLALEKQAKEREARVKEIKEYFNAKFLRALESSRSVSSVSEGKNKQRDMIRIAVSVKKVMFVIPTEEHKETLVTSGDLDINLTMKEPKDNTELWEIQEGLRKIKKSRDTIESANKGMKLHVQLHAFQIFYCDFVQLLRNPWKKVPKRHILMPIKLDLFYYDFQPVAKVNDEFVNYSYKRISGSGQSIIFKVTLSDLDVLSRISNYQMKLLEAAAPPKTEETPKEVEPVKDLIETAMIEDNKETDALKDPLGKPAQQIVEKDSTSSDLPVSRMQITNFNMKGLQIFIINDDQKIFVPVLDFVIPDIKVDLEQDEKTIVRLRLGLGVEYYNPSVSRWEPFIEKTGLAVDVNMHESSGVATTHVFFRLDQPDENTGEVMNINLSVKALSVVMNSLESFNNWSAKKALEEKAAPKEDRDSLIHLKIEDEDQFDEDNLPEENAQKVLEEEEDKVDYVSPYMIKNMTGYPVVAEEYINRTDFTDSALKKKTVKGAKYRKEKLGSKYKIDNEASVNLKLETGSKFKQAEGEGKLVLEEQTHEAKLMVTMNHPLFKVKPLYDLPLGQRYSKRKRLEGDHRILHDYSLICHNHFDDKKKVLTISSPVLVQNLTDVEMNLKINKKPDVLDILLQPGSTNPVPFDLISANFNIQFGGETTHSGNLQKFTNKEDGYSQKIKLSNDKFILAKVKRDPEIFQRIVIVLLPIVKLKNCLPFSLDLRLEQEGLQPREITLLPQTQTQIYSFDPDSKVYLKARVQGMNFSQLAVLIDQQRDCDLEELKLSDPAGNTSSIKLARISDSENMFTYHLYAAAVLINETPLELQPKYVKDKSSEGKAVAGTQSTNDEPFNSKLAILNSIDSNIKLQISQSYLDTHYPGFKPSRQPEVIPLKAIDSLAYSCQIENGNEKMTFELGVYITPLFVDKKENVYTKIIQVSPRNIFYNDTTSDLQIKQADTDTVVDVKAGTRTAYWWPNGHKERKLQVRLAQENAPWSSKFDAKILGSIPMEVPVEGGKPLQCYYEVKIDSGIEFTYFKLIGEKEAFYAFKNEISKCKVELLQKGDEPSAREIPTHEEVSFAWTNPDQKRIACLRFSGQNYKPYTFDMDLNKINTNERIKIESLDGKSSILVNIGVVLRKTTKFVKIREVMNIEDEKKAEQKIDSPVTKSQMIIESAIQGIGLSMISPYENSRIEALYIFLGGLEAFFAVNDHHTMLHFKMKTLAIDNNTTPLSPFPVLFTPSFKNKVLKDDFYLISFKMEKRNESKPEIQLYDELALEIQPITVGLDDITLGILLDVVQTIQTTIQAKPIVRYQHKYFHISNEETHTVLTKDTLTNYAEPRNEWQIKEPEVSVSWIYAKEFKISVLDITLSFKSRAEKAKNELLSSNVILKSFGVAFANVDEANIKIKGVKFEQVFETQSSLTNKLVQHYKESGIKQALKIVGSIDILGNPVSLFSNIGTGVVDFFEKPIEGFTKGPLDVAKGLGEGTTSLVKNTTKGVFNSASKATGALSSAFSALSMDQEFIKNREKMRMERSKNIGVSLKKGFTSVGVGVFEGVTGIFTQPLKGAKQGGVGGFFKGIGRGIIGLIAKPITGVLDLASHTTEGLKNTVTYFDDKANEEKTRMPRAFYGRDKYFKKYILFDAKVLNNLKVFEEGLFAFDHFTQSFVINDGTVNNILVVTFEHIIYFSQDKNKILFVVEPENINSIQMGSSGLKITVNQNATLKDLELKMRDDAKMQNITDTVNEIRYITLSTSLQV